LKAGRLDRLAIARARLRAEERKRSGIVRGANARIAKDAVRFEREWKSHRAGHSYR